ncbi:MAG: glycine--tRNA ligase subunit beta [Eggerthellaceae bacterium]|jgi:glycyl-tRNA synthetase beta chain|nr:glycine--tRNA ligase subunit beta [Eggerthellaceae bacterium]MDR2716055.1 glycine--tRNA ligase subunit beta [Coriobacteriaceae bacterium]
MPKTETLAFEIGTEEVPAADLARATGQLGGIVGDALDAARIGHGHIEVYSSPRRLAVLAFEVACETEALVEEYKGPATAIAFDDRGAPTKAAVGFAKGKGIDPDSLERRMVGDTEYVFALKHSAAQQTSDLLAPLLEQVIAAIPWKKSCRWGSQTALFSRPVRWLLALFGGDVVPVRFAGLVADRLTWGHRFLAGGPFEVAHADDLPGVLEGAFVVPSMEGRASAIRSGVAAIERETGLRSVLPEATLLEVVNLTEYPTPLIGSFDESFLKVPEEIIVDAMLKHQRYFPLYDGEGRLTNRFIAVSNGDPACSDIIIAGNERVVRPRLADAKFFYEEDLKRPLEHFVARLDTVVFQESLGSVRAKVDRLVALVEHVIEAAGLTAADAADARRAAYLCKADLVSGAVVEFTSVQGIMGAYYARAAGENEQVAEAIADHYRPRFADDAPPRSTVGKLVALTDKLDTICGLFAVGQGPTGSSDPFALRRGAIGIVNMLAAGLPVKLVPAVDAALEAYGTLVGDKAAVLEEVVAFFATRTKVMLRDADHALDVVEAVQAAGVFEPAQIIARVEALSAVREEMPDTMDDLAVAYARAHNLGDAALGIQVDAALTGAAEQGLLEALSAVESQVAGFLATNEYVEALKALAALRAPIDRFFEEVLIMDDDVALRENRLRLLNRFVAVFSPAADFGKMAKAPQ